jgi:hypothetical protein
MLPLGAGEQFIAGVVDTGGKFAPGVTLTSF